MRTAAPQRKLDHRVKQGLPEVVERSRATTPAGHRVHRASQRAAENTQCPRDRLLRGGAFVDSQGQDGPTGPDLAACCLIAATIGARRTGGVKILGHFRPFHHVTRENTRGVVVVSANCPSTLELLEARSGVEPL